ncbi:MAG: DUF86 domain-containing protein [Bacteroidetes bacterium]|nr:DUF86 domain-containing protein [Bacteroidota bacterium]
MPDSILLDMLESVLESLEIINERFEKVVEPDDFVSSSAGVLLFDAISMRLQVVGEMIKQIEKCHRDFLNQYTEIEWDKIMRLRDIISHHYENMDHEIIYDVCQNHVPKLKRTVTEMIMNFNQSS